MSITAMGQSTLLERIGSLLYIVNPWKTTFEHPSEVPNYVDEAVPLFFFFMILEAIIRWFQGKEVRFNESLSCIGIGILHEATVFISGTITFLGYETLLQYRIWDLPWDSMYTWFAAFVFIDFCYYWIHRMNHEINILWAAHQVHHSSEDYNLTVALRLSIFQKAAHFGFYLPLAIIGFPFAMVLVHATFNYLFQFWVHTDLFRSLGPIDYVIMSPSHHRVHHGSNKWCLDKNYASVFVLWDRLFGTFEPERKDEEIVYGLTDQPQTHNGVFMEFFYFNHLYEKTKSMTSWTDSLKALFYGPGWVPGSPRLGDPDTFPDIKAPRKKYDPQLPHWTVIYLCGHMFLAVIVQQLLLHQMATSSGIYIAMILCYLFVTIGVIGGLTDNRWWAPIIEAIRCAVYIGLSNRMPVTNIKSVDTAVNTYFFVSMMVWTAKSIQLFAKELKVSSKAYKVH